ncbi:NADH-quinone oxidoreductase subunit N, partial [Streptomyces sp. SID8455]|nr:NADH-quinone oxidoreductase subunit N [Streptomyces sp. SID8455]
MTADLSSPGALTTAADTAPSVVQTIDWLAVAPPTLTALAALLVLVADLFLPEHRKKLLGYGTLTALAAALALLIPLRAGDRATFCVTTGAQACSYTADHFALVIQALVLGG